MAGNNYFKLKEQLAEFDKKYEGKDDAFGLTQLTFPGWLSSPRLVMYAGAHIKQTVPQLHPDFPRVYTGRENVFAMLSSGYKKTNDNIKFAVMDDHNKVKVYLSSEPLLGLDFELYLNGEKVEGTSSIIRGKEVIITNLPKHIRANDLLLVSASNAYRPYKVIFRNFLDKFYYSKDDLGITYLNNAISFKKRGF